MVIVVICRFVKPTEEQKFLEKYNEDSQKNVGDPDFIYETLTKVNNSQDLPEFMRFRQCRILDIGRIFC